MVKSKLFAKLTPKEQFQISLIAIGGMLIFTSVFGVYIFFFSDFTFMFRLLTIINTIFGSLFLFSMFVGTYQSYQMVKLADSGNVMETLGALVDVQNIFNTNPAYPDENDNKMKGGSQKEENG